MYTYLRATECVFMDVIINASLKVMGLSKAVTKMEVTNAWYAMIFGVDTIN